MWSIVDYLKKPELVVAVQEWFGVEYVNSDGKYYDQSKISSKNNYVTKTNYVEHEKSIDSLASKLEHIKTEERSKADAVKGYRITNKFWYYLFVLGTELGDEIFYATMIPFWFWNIDGAVGRRVVFLWSVVMYIGQSLKDIIRWPRPGLPVKRLQTKWSIEYGMPSTHAMVR